jgi:hypothetical protein
VNPITSISFNQNEPESAESFCLFQNYPNPFNQNTAIQFEILRPSLIKLEIFDILGKLIYSFPTEQMEIGKYSKVWNGKDNTGTQIPSGIYCYQLKSMGYKQIRKMILLK